MERIPNKSQHRKLTLEKRNSTAAHARTLNRGLSICPAFYHWAILVPHNYTVYASSLSDFQTGATTPYSSLTHFELQKSMIAACMLMVWVEQMTSVIIYNSLSCGLHVLCHYSHRHPPTPSFRLLFNFSLVVSSSPRVCVCVCVCVRVCVCVFSPSPIPLLWHADSCVYEWY